MRSEPNFNIWPTQVFKCCTCMVSGFHRGFWLTFFSIWTHLNHPMAQNRFQHQRGFLGTDVAALLKYHAFGKVYFGVSRLRTNGNSSLVHTKALGSVTIITAPGWAKQLFWCGGRKGMKVLVSLKLTFCECMKTEMLWNVPPTVPELIPRQADILYTAHHICFQCIAQGLKWMLRQNIIYYYPCTRSLTI